MIAPTRFQPGTKAFYDYWQYEDGRQMLSELGYEPDLKDAEKMVPLLFETDRLADQVIHDCFIGKPFHDALVSIQTYLSAELPDENMPDSVRSLREEVQSVPAWANQNLIDLGRQLCNRAGKSGLIVLRNYSLMLGYQSAAINKPLIATGALHSGAVKRIADTTNFWFLATGAGALQIGQSGFDACMRTRLIHAYSRVMIKQKLDWDISEQGEPLNHWDMVATYLGFSLVFMRGLIKLGITISEEESEAVYHFWKYIGYLIGIPPEIMPTNNNEAIESLYLWSKTQPEADADSIALAQALHHEPMHAAWPPRKHQKKFIQHVNLSFNDFLIGRRSCEILELPRPKFPALAKIVKGVNKADDKLGLLSSSYRKLQITHGRDEQRVIRDRVNM